MRSRKCIFPGLALTLLLTFGCSQKGIKVASAPAIQDETTALGTADLSDPANYAKVIADLGTQLAAGENKKDLALKLFDQAVQVAEKIEDPSEKINTLSAIALKLADIKQTDRALQIFDGILPLAETIEDHSSKIKTLTAIAVNLANLKQKERSLELFDRAVKVTKEGDKNFAIYYEDEAFQDIAIQLVKARFTKQGLQLTETISSEYRKAEALNGIALILAEAGEVKQAKQTLLEALKLARGITGDYAYESNGSCGNNKFEVLAKIAGNLSLLADFDAALEVAQSITGCSSASGGSGVDYQASAFLGILAHLTNTNQLNQTWEGAQKIQNNTEKAHVWSAIAIKLAEMGEMALARSVTEKISKEIPSVTRINSNSALEEFGLKEKKLRDIAVKFAEVGQFEAALQVGQMINEMAEEDKAANREVGVEPGPSVKAATLADIAGFLATAGKVEQALQVAGSIGDAEVKVDAKIAIAVALQKAGQQSKAEEILSQNLKVSEIAEGDDFSANESLQRIAVALVTLGRVEQALKIANSIQEKFVREKVLANIAAQLADGGELDRALQLANTLTTQGPKKDALTKIASKFSELGQFDRSFQVAKSIPGGSDDTKDKMLADIADSFAQKGQPERALEVVQTIASDPLKAESISEIAAQLARSK